LGETHGEQRWQEKNGRAPLAKPPPLAFPAIITGRHGIGQCGRRLTKSEFTNSLRFPALVTARIP
jgi:hypothetical protein